MSKGFGFTCLLVLLLQGCTVSRYQQDVDSTPVYKSIDHLVEPKPVREPLSRRGNADEYEVWGQTYQVLKGLREYSQTGTASWYGQKFHGHETSNGEIFDVYKFSAAHKSLPLPSYVKVTNLSNQKSLVVRVNDRGPFHGDRLIDLSFAAAMRLGYANNGTAQVKVELVAAPLSTQEALEAKNRYLQVAAFSAQPSAVKFKNTLLSLVKEPVHLSQVSREGKTLHKVKIGPMSVKRAKEIQSTLKDHDIQPGLLLPLSL